VAAGAEAAGAEAAAAGALTGAAAGAFEAERPPFFPPDAASSCGSVSRSFRTTGGSTVDDADRTNSPSSWSLAMTTLLSTPSSLASS
jgi:hypothetical protein